MLVSSIRLHQPLTDYHQSIIISIVAVCCLHRNALGHISDDVKDLLEHEEQPRDEIM